MVSAVKSVIYCAAFETESLSSLAIKTFNNKNFRDLPVKRSDVQIEKEMQQCMQFLQKSTRGEKILCTYSVDYQ